jgi:hypothetical protein
MDTNNSALAECQFCANCNAQLRPKPSGHTRRYCSGRCRGQAWRTRNRGPARGIDFITTADGVTISAAQLRRWP